MKPDRNRWMRPWALGMVVMLGVLFVSGLAGCGEEKVESPNAKTAAPARAPGENVQQEKRGK
jgi:hypothetical protein